MQSLNSVNKTEEIVSLETANNQSLLSGRSYTLGETLRESVKDVVQKVMVLNKLNEEDDDNDPWTLAFYEENPELKEKNESDKNGKEQKLEKIETAIRKSQVKIPTWDVKGPLNYSMSLEEMKETLTKKFAELASSGILMTRAEFNKKNPDDFYERSMNLTRLWGAEYLKTHLDGLKGPITAATHFLIVDDEASLMDVTVSIGGAYPNVWAASQCELVAERIIGEKCAPRYSLMGELTSLGYADFMGDPGNIIRDSKGRVFVVDTEEKSFDEPKLSGESADIRDYLKSRFQVLSTEDVSDTLTFKIDLTKVFKK